jgi:hypothetical protein
MKKVIHKGWGKNYLGFYNGKTKKRIKSVLQVKLNDEVSDGVDVKGKVVYVGCGVALIHLKDVFEDTPINELHIVVIDDSDSKVEVESVCNCGGETISKTKGDETLQFCKDCGSCLEGLA